MKKNIPSFSGAGNKAVVLLCICAAIIMISSAVAAAIQRHDRPLLISGCRTDAYVSDSSDILSCARSLGYSCNTLSQRSIVIPADFSAALDRYNDIQKPMGTDLRSYRGKNCRLYTIPLRDGRYMHLIRCADRIIAGDIDNGCPDGIFYPLTKKNPPDIEA